MIIKQSWWHAWTAVVPEGAGKKENFVSVRWEVRDSQAGVLLLGVSCWCSRCPVTLLSTTLWALPKLPPAVFALWRRLHQLCHTRCGARAAHAAWLPCLVHVCQWATSAGYVKSHYPCNCWSYLLKTLRGRLKSSYNGAIDWKLKCQEAEREMGWVKH